MLPFALDPAALLAELSRVLAVGALFVTFGTLLIRIMVAGAMPEVHGLARLQCWALTGAAAGAVLWWAMQTAAMAETDGMAETFAAMPAVLGQTTFGHLIALRLMLLALVGLAFAVRRDWTTRLAALAAGIAVALQAAHLHALAMQPGPSLLLASETLHMLAAAAWLGSLPALLILVARAPPSLAAIVARRFSPLGIAAVLALAASAAMQAATLLGGWAALFGTTYGRLCLAKLTLFGALLALAARNRLHTVPRLAAGEATSRAALMRSIAVATLLGAAVLVLASLLSALPPGIAASTPPG